MKLDYAMESEMPLRVTMTMADVRQLIKLLEPIASDDEADGHWLSKGLLRELKTMQHDAAWGARAHFNWFTDQLDESK